MKTNTTVPSTRINTPITTTAETKGDTKAEATKPEPKSKTVTVSIELPRKVAKRLEKAASLIGISLGRLVELKLGQS